MSHTTFTQPYTARENILQGLDEEILAFTEQLRLLKMRRNSFSVTHSLPHEVLSEIFVLVQVACDKTPHFPQFSGSHFPCFKSWNGITQVSAHWRKIALQCTELWCNINYKVPGHAVHDFLMRSRERGLVVDIIAWTISGLKLLRDILLHHHRLEYFELGTSEEGYTEILPLLVSTAGPKLKELIFHGPDKLKLPDNLFMGVTPRLVNLAVNGVYFDPTSFIPMHGLTSLRANMYDFPVGSLTTWLGVLQHMHRLQHLRFDNISDGIPSLFHPFVPISNNVGTVYLPELRSFYLNGSSLLIDLDFLSHLTFPSQTKFKFLSDSCGDEDEDLSSPPLLQCLHAHRLSRQNFTEPEITKIIFKRRYIARASKPDAIQLLAFVKDDTQNLLNTDHDKIWGHLDLAIWATSLRTCEGTQMTEIASLPVSQVTSFAADCGVDTASWEILLDRFPNLKTITCSHRSIQPLLVALGNHNLGSNSSLEALHFYKTIPSRFEETLMNALHVRRDGGCPIREIRLTRCVDLEEDFLHRLERFVRVVQCDDCDLIDGYELSHDNISECGE